MGPCRHKRLQRRKSQKSPGYPQQEPQELKWQERWLLCNGLSSCGGLLGGCGCVLSFLVFDTSEGPCEDAQLISNLPAPIAPPALISRKVFWKPSSDQGNATVILSSASAAAGATLGSGLGAAAADGGLSVAASSPAASTCGAARATALAAGVAAEGVGACAWSCQSKSMSCISEVSQSSVSGRQQISGRQQNSGPS